MKQGTVKFSKEFVTPIGLKEWVGIEMEYDMSSECPKEVLTNAKTIVEQWHNENNQNKSDYPILLGTYQGVPSPSAQPIITIERTSETERIAKLIKDIYACTELDGENGLLSYAKVAATTSHETQQVYDIMFKKLTPNLHNGIYNNMGTE